MAAPQDLGTLEPLPHGRTARRLQWDMLPPMLRREIEQRLGSPVVRADSADAGFTPGFASVLTGRDGRRLFVKAASKKAQRPFAESYREEARKRRALPPDLPAPRLLWSQEDDLWVVLGLEHVDATAPTRPWRSEELGRCLDTLERVAEKLTPAPVPLVPYAQELAEMVAAWDHVRAVSPDWPHLDEAAALAARVGEATAGDTVVHTDARDDNFLLTDADALLCDWNWPVVGAPWIDTVLLLVSAFGDGHDAEAILRERPLTRDVDPEYIDVLLALVTGYFLQSRDRPVPNSSPYIRAHARWYSEVAWAWLAQRRGWS